MRTSVTSTRSTVKVTELPKLRKLHFSRSISSAVFTWSSELMVDGDSMGAGLQLVGARFLNFFLGKPSWEFKLCRISIFHEIRVAIFWYSWCYSHMVGHACSPTRTVYVGVTLTRSKVKVTEHLNFWQLPITTHFQVYFLRHFRMHSKLMFVSDNMGPGLQLVWARLSTFLLGKLSREFKLCGMSIFRDIQTAIFL